MPVMANEGEMSDLTKQQDKVLNYYGVFLNIDSSFELSKSVQESNAERKIEIAVQIDGVRKEMTISEFMRQLGFLN